MKIAFALATLALSCCTLQLLNADEPPKDAPADTERQAQRRAGQQAAIASARASLDAAMQTVEQARASLTASQTEQADEDAELAASREELSRAHRQLREASRDIARAHRELAMMNHQFERVRLINLGDRAVIGVLLGDESANGLEVSGVSPDGPAERAGLRQNDVLTAIGGVDLTERTDGGARDALLAVVDEVTAGEELDVTVSREGEVLNLTVVPEQREPSSWQSMMRLPDLPPMGPGGLHLLIERLEGLDFDEEELAARIEEITEQAKEFEYMFMGDDGETIEFSDEFEFDGEPMSRLGEHAMREANIWFGLPQTRGLELASLNPELGKYFKAASGVLVIQAREDNVYGLQAGDVIRQVGGSEVNSPADFLRALRDSEPGTEIKLGIKRDRREQSLTATVPENRLGMVRRHRMHTPPPPPVVE